MNDQGQKEGAKRRKREEETAKIADEELSTSASLNPQPSTLTPCVIAIDPGTAKCGVAAVQSNGCILHQEIVSTEKVVERVHALITAHNPAVLICGQGTGSKPILQALRAAQLPPPIQPVDEAHTSEAARARFVRENRPPLLQRLLPYSLRTPWLPYDDYVAIILAERYLQTRS